MNRGQKAGSPIATDAISKMGLERRGLIAGTAFIGSSLAATVGVPAVAAPAPDLSRRIVDVREFGASGDGVTDDTAALQAAIDHALSTGINCYVPTGIYKITETLRIGSTLRAANNRAGWKFFGDGAKSDLGSGRGGTLFRLHGAGHEAGIRVGSAAWRSCLFENFGIECVTAGGTKYGFLFDSTEFSGHAVNRVHVARSETAFAILKGTGANGENTFFSDCYAELTDCFFYSNAGQAYVQNFTHCGGTLNPGGTWFSLDVGGGGGGLHVTDFNGTGVIPAGSSTSNTTIFADKGNSSIANFYGGRIEHVTQLYANAGGSPNLRPCTQFIGMQFGIDSVPAAPRETKSAFIDITAAATMLTLQSCSFAADTGTETIEIRLNQSWSQVTFRDCSFLSLPRPPFVTDNFGDDFNQVVFQDCKTSALTQATALNDRPFPFNRNVTGGRSGAIGRRRAYSENGFIHSGRPQNYLVRPEFSLTGGRGIALDHPWVHTGAAKIADVMDWSSAPESGNSSSPWARSLGLRPSSGIYQDIEAIDLSSADRSVENDAYKFHNVTYQAMLTSVSSQSVRTNLRIAIENDATGAVYDEARFIGGVSPGDDISSRLVTLSVNIRQTREPCHPRLRIENMSETGAIELRIAWQMIGRDDKASFAPSSLEVSSFTEEWGASAESIRAWSRLALPYKTDAFGRDAVHPLNDLRSDIYLSATTEHLNSYQGGTWWEHPLQTRLSAVPTTGQWPGGAQIFDRSPAAGGALGWIQLTVGDINCTQPWRPAALFGGGERVYRGASVYECIKPGRSNAGSGPLGTDMAILDGSARWRFLGTLAPSACDVAWSPQKAYELGAQVSNNSSVYLCEKAGSSADAGGPDGIGSAVADGSILWRYVGPLAIFKTFGNISL